MEPKCSLRLMNNKSMKGYYLYLKLPKMPGRYYRFTGEYPKELYQDYYLKKSQGKAETNIRHYKKKFKKVQKRVPKKKRYKPINKMFKQGTTTIYSRNMLKKSNQDIKNEVEKLMRKSLKDTTETKSVSSIQNQNKLRTRMEFKITLKGNEGETLGTISHIGKKSLYEVIYGLSDTLKKGMRIQPGSPALSMKLKRKGFKYRQMNKDGFLNSVDVKTVMRN